MPSHQPIMLSPTRLPALVDPHANIRQAIRQMKLVLAALFGGLGLLAALVPIGGAVIGAGQVGVESRVKQITHPVGGVISQILVQNGQFVRRGQVLVRLDDRVMGVDATFSALSVDQLLAQQARLEAERIGGATINFPATLTARKTDGAQRAMADETALFRTKTSEYARLEAQLQARIRQYGQEISADNAQIAALEQQQRLLVPERAGVQTLWAKKLVTIGKLNQLERTAADIEGQIGAFHAKIAQSNAQITEVRERILQLAQTRRSDAGTQLAQVNAALNQQLVRSATATDAFDRSIIRAPYDGVVDKLAFTTIGGVIRPAEVIMELVPVRDRLLVEGMVSPSDIDRVQVGQPARVRFTAFSVTDSLELPGKVSFVAAERTTERDTQHSYYTVRVEIDQAELKRNAAKQLKPGMPAEIYVSTGNRSMLSYITKPMRDQFARAFRDS